MAFVKRDEFGIYINAGGYKARPVVATKLVPGDEAKTHHFAGTILAGVGKNKSCGRGKYLEYWVTCGDDGFGPVCEKQIAWYKVEALRKYGHKFGFAEPSSQDHYKSKQFISEGYRCVEAE